MGEFIGHHCGLAMVRLRKPLSHFRERYGDPAWGLRRLFLLMEKQHNRGQDGAGIAVVKYDMPPGEPFLRRLRSDRHNAIERIFDAVMRDVKRLPRNLHGSGDDSALKMQCDFLGDLFIGHLRYGTHSGSSVTNCHPLVRKSTTASRNLAIAGNFNMTNSAALFQRLLDDGLSPVGESDTQVILEGIGYWLDREHDHLAAAMGPGSFQGLEGRALAEAVSREVDLVRVLEQASTDWDGGYVFTGALGNGDAFVCRDPAGIRPAHFIETDEYFAMASERAALANVFAIEPKTVQAVEPGHCLSVKRDGTIKQARFTEPIEIRQCTFERVYFSRGNDPDIYQERKALGRHLAPRVLEMIEDDVEHAVFSYIPNTAETAYVGLVEELDRLNRLNQIKAVQAQIASGDVQPEALTRVLTARVRAEKIAHKDQRLRTFITHDRARRDLVLHIYDITRGVVKQEDALVVLDDSIVRGTTLRESIITILSRLKPKRIITASSAPPIMYPDCYGIDMSQLGRFIAFEAAVELLREKDDLGLLDEVEASCRSQAHRCDSKLINHVQAIYEPFTLEDISRKVSELVRPPRDEYAGEVDIIYQSVEGLQASMPDYTGDWYFTGRYPTP
ncbi:MAG: amidophosphoribosyltransferase, partial [Planctomycetota bacterium]